LIPSAGLSSGNLIKHGTISVAVFSKKQEKPQCKGFPEIDADSTGHQIFKIQDDF
jgi:hypothetical protein